MWSDIIKALELLINVLLGKSFQGRKRRRIARQLVLIFYHLDQVIIQGRSILSAIQSESVLSENNDNRSDTDFHTGWIKGALLANYLRALQNLVDSLNDPNILTLLKIQLPEFITIKRLALAKWEKVLPKGGWSDHSYRVRLSELTTGAKITREPRDWQRREGELRANSREVLHEISQGKVGFEWRGMTLDQEHKILDNMNIQCEKLRLFLIEHFELEDFLQSNG